MLEDTTRLCRTSPTTWRARCHLGCRGGAAGSRFAPGRLATLFCADSSCVALPRSSAPAQRTFGGELLKATEQYRHEQWEEHVHHVNWELFDQGAEAFGWYAMQELIKGAQGMRCLTPPRMVRTPLVSPQLRSKDNWAGASEAADAEPLLPINESAAPQVSRSGISMAATNGTERRPCRRRNGAGLASSRLEATFSPSRSLTASKCYPPASGPTSV